MKSLPSAAALALLLLLAAPVIAADGGAPVSGTWTQTGSLPAPEAHQAAAADDQFVYAITDAKIARYDRRTGRPIAVSTGKAHHLNSGFLHDGKLYCAHSNYPKTPEESQIMVLDPASMQVTTFKDFGNYGGSLTWCIREGDHWWCNFAKYDKDNARTFLVKFDDSWKELARFTYPPELIGQLGKYSLSGGVWRDGLLVVTGHTDPVLFRLRLPKGGTVLELVDKQKAPFTGQGIARDPVTGGLVGVNRGKKLVIFASPPSSQKE